MGMGWMDGWMDKMPPVFAIASSCIQESGELSAKTATNQGLQTSQ